jgi:hypothetical protein
MPFELYRWLCSYFLGQAKFFEWAYLTVCWNLMCRSNNVAAIRLSHLCWVEDSLAVALPQTKTDQGSLLLLILL